MPKSNNNIISQSVKSFFANFNRYPTTITLNPHTHQFLFPKQPYKSKITINKNPIQIITNTDPSPTQIIELK